MATTRLEGPWRATATTAELRRECRELDFDDSSWAEIEVPGHWAADERYADRTSLLYRTEFELAGAPSDGSNDRQNDRHWLVFDGIWARSDVWLDGDYLGPTDTWFTRDEFEVTEQITARSTHALAVEVVCPRPALDAPDGDMRGIFAASTIVGHRNPGGIWRPVRIESTGPVRMHKNRLLCSEATAERATIHLRSELRSHEPRSVNVITTVRPPGGGVPIEHRREHHLAAGETVLEWDVHVSEPQRWWPWSLGGQPLYRVSVAVEADGSISDLWERTTGLRTVTMDSWHLSVNGTRLFAKGVDRWPTAPPGQTSAELVAADVERAKDLGLDLLRVESHVAPNALYEAADRAGMLVWQDLPLRGEVRRTVQSKAVDGAHRLVDALGSHPSIAIWGGHYDPTGTTTGTAAGARTATTLTSRRSLFGVARQQLPTFTKSVLDRFIARAFRVADGTRPIVASSGTWPSAPSFDGTDTHLRFGWNSGTGRELESFARRIPRMVRWVSSFGGQAIPENPSVDLGSWPANLGLLADRFGLHETSFRSYVAAADYDDAASWVRGSQAYQATLLRRQIETLRRLKYHPTGGFTFAALADGRPAISFAIFDHDRQPKQAVEAVRAACRPLIVVADRLPPHVAADDPILLDVHVVSDHREAMKDLVVDAHLAWADGEHRWRWGGEVAADSVARVGSINWIVPPSRGPVTLSLALHSAGKQLATNVYQTVVR